MLHEPLPGGRQGRKAPNADHEAARRPGIRQRDDPECGPPIAAGRCCRNDGDSDAAADHLANRVKIGKADAQFQTAACAGRMILHLVLEGVARREADMVIGKGITK